MDALYDVLRYVVALSFIFLAVVGSWQWYKRRDAPTKWLALTFLSIGIVAGAGLVQPEDPEGPGWDIVIKIEILILILFPYLLFRFAATFGSISRRTEMFAAALTAGLAIWTLFLPEFPEPGTEPTGQFLYYTWALLGMWTILSTIVTYKLWSAGRGQPPLTRRRMRMLSVGSALLSVVLLISGVASSPDDGSPVSIIIQLLTLSSALTFYFGFSTPATLRATWRRPSEEALRRAISELMVADTEEQVSNAWFPHVTGIVGAKGVIAMREDGSIIGSHGVDAEMLTGLTRVMGEGEDKPDKDVIHLQFPFGSMTVWASAYTPFFGSDEVELIESLGALANLAFERVHSAQLRNELAQAQMRRQQALEINDNVVQGLTVAKLAFDLGDREKAMTALQQTLVSARSIITRLLQDIEQTDQIKPGQLVRDRAASVGERSAG
jgi:hypothetical protein